MVGLYRPWMPSADEGWTRWLFDTYAVPYVSLTNDDIARGGSPARVHGARDSVDRAGGPPLRVAPRPTSRRSSPGGWVRTTSRNLREFVEGGGTLVALGASVDFVIEALDLPVEDFLRRVVARATSSRPDRRSASPSTRRRPSARACRRHGGMDRGRERVPGPAGRRDAGGGAVRARAGDAERLGRGRIVDRGPTRRRRGSLVEPDGSCCSGSGRSTAGQSLGTYPLLFNSLKRRR